MDMRVRGCPRLLDYKHMFVVGRERHLDALGAWAGRPLWLHRARTKNGPYLLHPLSGFPLTSLFYGFFWGFGGVRRGFSSLIYRTTPRHTPPVSGGADYVEDHVEVARKPPTIAPSLYELNQAPLPEEVEVALDRAGGAA